MQARAAPKPKPKYDAKTGKWVVANWDGSVSGIKGGDQQSFERLGQNNNDNINPQPMDIVDDHNSSGAEAASTATTTNNNNNNHPTTVEQRITISGPPFCKINAVSPLSPASEADLRQGDEVVQFGDLDHTNHFNLTALPPAVMAAAETRQQISITVLRLNIETNQKVPVRVGLTPKPWPGRGLLGCHIVPYSA